MGKPRPAPANDFGLTAVSAYDDFASSPPIEQQLTASGVDFVRNELPNIVGMGGSAWLVSYTSPNTGRDVTVLVIPHRPEVDQYAEDYFYFEGTTAAQALTRDWTDLYDRALALTSPQEQQ